jgi:hypothetical protein
MVAQAGFAPEPWRGSQQLVARRVPGVTAMPYERWGFALLPGGNLACRHLLLKIG